MTKIMEDYLEKITHTHLSVERILEKLEMRDVNQAVQLFEEACNEYGKESVIASIFYFYRERFNGHGVGTTMIRPTPFYGDDLNS